MENTTYNGWHNRSTWIVMLWMDNEESAYRFYVERVRAYKDAGKRFRGVAARAVCLGALGDRTPDGINVRAKWIDWPAIAEAMRESVS